MNADQELIPTKPQDGVYQSAMSLGNLGSNLHCNPFKSFRGDKISSENENKRLNHGFHGWHG